MVDVAASAQLFEPYKNFKFRVKWDSRYVAGVSKVGALSRTTDVIDYREGGDPSTVRRSPGLTRFEPVTLERGLSQDMEFIRWANKVWYVQGRAGSEASLADFRKDLLIEVYNGAGQKVVAFNLYRCWVSELRALSELDANGNAVAFESITVQNEGWLRDTDFALPEEPRFDVPPATA